MRMDGGFDVARLVEVGLAPDAVNGIAFNPGRSRNRLITQVLRLSTERFIGEIGCTKACRRASKKSVCSEVY